MSRHGWRRRTLLVAAAGLGGCVSVDVGRDAPPLLQYTLGDPGLAGVARLETPLRPALLLQAAAGDPFADGTAIAYTRGGGAYAFYQLASWAERPARRVARLLQQRLAARGVAGAVGQLGDPMRADRLLVIAVDAVHHDLSAPPGLARLAITAELYDRRSSRRLDQRRFEAAVATPGGDAPSCAAAMSAAVARAFDELLPWLESALRAADPPLPPGDDRRSGDRG